LETWSYNKHDAQESLEKTEVLTQKEDTTLTDPPSYHAETQNEALIEKCEENPLSTPGKPATDTASKKPSTEIVNPIQYVTTLHFNRGNSILEVLFIKDLIPILVEEIPPSEFFFSKKRRVVVRREAHQRHGVTVNKNRMILYG
jgi:hypothetical protein